MREHRFALAMLTAARARPTITASLASLRAAGFDEPVHVFDDGGGGVPLNDALTVRYARGRPLGITANALSALRTIVELDADWFLLLEDDTSWLPAARTALQAVLSTLDLERFGALSLHCLRIVSRGLERVRGVATLPPGLYESRPGAHTRGAQALVFTRASAQALIDAPRFQDRAYASAWLDASIGLTLAELGRRLWYRLPCLVRHDLGLRNSSWASAEAQASPFLACDY